MRMRINKVQGSWAVGSSSSSSTSSGTSSSSAVLAAVSSATVGSAGPLKRAGSLVARGEVAAQRIEARGMVKRVVSAGMGAVATGGC